MLESVNSQDLCIFKSITLKTKYSFINYYVHVNALKVDWYTTSFKILKCLFQYVVLKATKLFEQIQNFKLMNNRQTVGPAIKTNGLKQLTRLPRLAQCPLRCI